MREDTVRHFAVHVFPRRPPMDFCGHFFFIPAKKEKHT